MTRQNAREFCSEPELELPVRWSCCFLERVWARLLLSRGSSALSHGCRNLWVLVEMSRPSSAVSGYNWPRALRPSVQERRERVAIFCPMRFDVCHRRDGRQLCCRQIQSIEVGDIFVN